MSDTFISLLAGRTTFNVNLFLKLQKVNTAVRGTCSQFMF